MDVPLFFSYGQSGSLAFATECLSRMGYKFSDHITSDVTHLLTDIPSSQIPTEIIRSLPSYSTIIGGNLPTLLCDTHPSIDLLQDETFLCSNAAVTAQCAIRIGYESMNSSYEQIRCMVIGWGRIGKHLVHLLTLLGANVTVAVRNPKDAAMLRSFKAFVIPMENIEMSAHNQDLIFNTVPAPVLYQSIDEPRYIAIDLASTAGISGNKVIHARGLPGKMSPALTGKLIAQRIDSILSEGSK